MSGMIIHATGAAFKSLSSNQVSTKPHWSFHVGVSAAALTAVVALTAAVGVAIIGMATQAIVIGAFGGAIGGAMLLMSFYLYRFSRDHNIVKAGQALGGAVHEQKEVVGRLEDLEEKSEEAQKEAAKAAQLENKQLKERMELLEEIALDLSKALNDHKEQQKTYISKAKKYTQEATDAVRKQSEGLTETSKKQQKLIKDIDAYEETRKETNVTLANIIEAKRVGIDLLTEVKEELQGGLKCLRKHAKLAQTLQENNKLQQRTVNAIKAEEAASREKVDELNIKIEELSKLLVKLRGDTQ
ncbi:MAG: hypothetical protein KR126chlam2_00946 [Chlamydiae bacterium]|nr:hypothetical protein [Chlamydiota bacterium]